MNEPKFLAWTDEELEQLAETIELCYSESMGPDTDIDKQLLIELEARELELPWWAEQCRRGEE